MSLRNFRFEWDENKADANKWKHGISFKTASTVFRDPQLMTIPDLRHSETEERWFSVGWASDGRILAVSHLWREIDAEATEIRLISARPATQTEIRRYNIGEAYD